MPTRFATLAAAGALTLAVFGATPAFAADKPPVGSADCTSAVAGTVAVINAKAALDTAKEALQSDRNALALAQVAVPFVQANVDILLGAINEDTISVASAQRAFDRAVARATGALCVKVVVTTTPTVPDPSSPTTPLPSGATTPESSEPAPVESTTVVTQINNNITVDPTADDGSVATTSGNQVTVVPEGSAQTGSL